jgi:dihydrolipoamide dehydrogenase
LKSAFADRIFLNTKVSSLVERDGQVEVAWDGPDQMAAERFDRVLVAVGRRPNSANLGLENTDIKTDDRGFVQCDRQQRTADARILAIGDVAGEPMLAHKATHQAKVAVEVLAGEPAAFDKLAMPAVVFTDPEIAWVGLTETAAKRDGREFKAAIFPWAASGRAQSLGRTEGLTKWLVDPKTERVLGCGIVGAGAGELIAEAALALEMGCEARDITETVHVHPTLGETLMNAAEVFFGTATEIYKPRRK